MALCSYNVGAILTLFLDIMMPSVYDNHEVIHMTLKQMRQEKGLTQVKCAEFLQIPLRTYKRY